MPVETSRQKIEPSLNFSKACPNPLKNGPKPLAKLYSSPKNSRVPIQLEGQRRPHSCLCHLPTHLVLFLVTTSIMPSLQAYAELHALSPLRGSIGLVWLRLCRSHTYMLSLIVVIILERTIRVSCRTYGILILLSK